MLLWQMKRLLSWSAAHYVAGIFESLYSPPFAMSTTNTSANVKMITI